MTAAELLEAARQASRGELKRLAARLDADPALRAAVAALADLPADWPPKRLLRVARGHEEAARERTNPVMRDEAFTCAHCGREVPPHGRTARDHCPSCLRSLHVDVVPGDRAATCGGILDPVGVEVRGADTVLRYRCRRCGAERTNRALLDGADPDDWSRIAALSAGEGT